MQFSQQLDSMADMLRHPGSKVTEDPQGAVKPLDRPSRNWEEGANSSADLVATLNDALSHETQRVRDELVCYLWDPRKRPKQLEWSSLSSQDTRIASMQAA